MRRIATILLGLVLLSPAAPAEIHCPPGRVCRTQPPVASTPHPAIVRVISMTQKGPWLGTGVLVRPPRECEFGVVLTANHGLPMRPDSVVVVSSGRRVTARILGRDPTLDLAVLSIPKPSTNPYKIATELPRIGDVLWAGGYAGPEGYFQIVSGRLRQFVTPEKPVVGPKNSVLKFEGSAEIGVSGGVISNDAGRLVGIVSASDHEFVFGTHCVHILKFLDRILAPVPMTPMNSPSRPVTPPPAAAESVSTPSDSPIVADHLDKIRGQVADDIAATQEADNERLTGIEAAIEALAGASRQSPEPVIQPTSLLKSALPGVLTALGWSGPPSIAALLALKTATWAVRRRKKKRSETTPKSSTVKSQEPEPEPESQDGVVADAADKFPPEIGSIPRDDTEAIQFLRLSQMEGRSPVHDALVGRIAFDELQNTIDHEPAGPEAVWAQSLKDTLLTRFNEMAPTAVFDTPS